MPSLDWSNLRPLRGTQQSAFEELCCQLAAKEPRPAGSTYRRIGAPDAGIECVWEDSANRAHGWQAKYFLQPPTAAQWKQIDESVKAALKHYPNLTAYTVCLPIDRPDARIHGQKSMMQRWNDRVDKWTQHAGKHSMTVSFEYWGQHEIFERLARAENAGKQFFWFQSQALTADWFEAAFEVARANAGPRYSPELNVELAISKVFDGLARNQRFFAAVRRQWGVARRKAERAVDSVRRVEDDLHGKTVPSVTVARSSIRPALKPTANPNGSTRSTQPAAISSTPASDPVAAESEAARTALAELGEQLRALHPQRGEEIPFESIRRAIGKVAGSLKTLHDLIAAVDDSTQLGGSPRRGRISAQLENRLYELWHAQQALRHLDDLCNSSGAKLANNPALLLTGDAGTGKTHLFCDVAKRALAEGHACVVLLGEQFVSGEPWPQIFQQLQLGCASADEFLGAMSAAGEASGVRALILIDALNEGEGREVWPNRLAGFLAKIARYPWVAIAVSVRSSYAPLIVQPAAEDSLVELEHHGFADNEFAAVRRFFHAYGLELPGAPLLSPEFSNPLFLKLFCSGIRNSGQTRVPDGLDGISAVFSFFLDSIQKSLADPARLSFDAKIPIVEPAVDLLAAEMRTNGRSWIPRARATALLNGVLPPRAGYESTLLRHLISEGVLAEELVWVGPNEERQEVVRFSYERLADHRIAEILLDGHLAGAATNPAVSGGLAGSGEAQPAHGKSGARIDVEALLNDETLGWANQGIVEALSIQAPERTGKEIWELAAQPREPSRPVQEAFLSSLEWRRADAITATAQQIVGRFVRAPSALGNRLRDLVLAAAAREDHPFNAAYLDRLLRPESMSDRDAWWSIYVADCTDETSALWKLINWIRRAGGQVRYTDAAAALCATALGWTLTTSNRRVRDHATKSLVSLLHKRPAVLKEFVERMHSVNDPYIVERVYAVAYGCALRGLPGGELGLLARFVYEAVFGDNPPTPHLLLRDYARGIVELAAARGCLGDLAVDRARPPYGSEPPGAAPLETELKTKYYEPFHASEDPGYFALWSSLMGGDFGRYTVGTNSHSFDWTGRPLFGPHPQTLRAQYDSFFDHLPPKLRDHWREMELFSFVVALPEEELPEKLKPLQNRQRARPEALAAHREAFRAQLPDHLRAEFDRVKDWEREPHEPELFDLDYACRWLFQRVLALGWTPEKFGQFDRGVNRFDGRGISRTERMGKKYQWIAWHEFTARVADNFEFRSDPWSATVESYSGPWQIHGRDIDPSYLGKGGDSVAPAERSVWWQPVRHTGDWRAIAEDRDWIASTEDLPALGSIIGATNPSDQSKWIWLHGVAAWREPEPPDEEPYERARRWIRCDVAGLIVRHGDRPSLVRSLRNGAAGNSDLLRLFEPTQVFLGEFPWAPAFSSQREQLGQSAWTRARGVLPAKVLRPAMSYLWESAGPDYSIELTVNLRVPASRILETGGFGGAGTWPVQSVHALLVNPSQNRVGPDALLARDPDFPELLRRKGLELVWLMRGEKLLIGHQTRDAASWAGRLDFSIVGHFGTNGWQEWRSIELDQPMATD